MVRPTSDARGHELGGSSPGRLGKAHGSEAGRGVGAAGGTPTMGVVVESRTDTPTRPPASLSDRKTSTLRLARPQRKGTGGGPFLPRILADWIALGSVVQVRPRCPAVKRECPAPRRNAGRHDDTHSCLTARTEHGQLPSEAYRPDSSHDRRNWPHY